MSVVTISVVIPAHNAAHTLPQTLTALGKTSPRPLEIIVVDDGSADETAHIAQSAGARVLSLEKNMGAAAAKNRGAAIARGDVLAFVDADIVVPPRLISKFQDVFAVRGCDGAVGLLDENIRAKNWASQFKNLWMNFTYARFAKVERIGLFYTSIAAIKREMFLSLGGFDENYRGASIAEDTEFGQRAWGRGVNIVLDPNLRVIHLKAYTAPSVLREDFKRAYALTLMRLRKRGAPFFTSVPLFYQLAVPTIYIAMLLLAVSLFVPNFIFAALSAVVIFYLLNAPLLRFLARKRGIFFALRSAFFLPVDVFVVSLGMLTAVLNFARGIQY